jgi:hypothetical protein
VSRKDRMYVINLKQTMSLGHPSFATSSLNETRVRARAAPDATGLTRDGDNQELTQRFSLASGRDLSGRELSENSGFHSHRQSFGTASPSRNDSRNFRSGSRARSIDMRLELHYRSPLYSTLNSSEGYHDRWLHCWAKRISKDSAFEV